MHKSSYRPIQKKKNAQGFREMSTHTKSRLGEYLGVIIDRHLNWKKHIKTVRKKLLKSMYMALQIRKIVSDDIEKLIYTAVWVFFLGSSL